MASLRAFLSTIPHNEHEVSLLEVAAGCGDAPPVSLRSVMRNCQVTILVRLAPTQPEWDESVVFQATIAGWGRLQSITIPDRDDLLAVSFLERGETADDCNEAAERVRIGAGETAGPMQLTRIFGTANPHLPVDVRACIDWVGEPHRRLDITATYDPVDPPPGHVRP